MAALTFFCVGIADPPKGSQSDIGWRGHNLWNLIHSSVGVVYEISRFGDCPKKEGRFINLAKDRFPAKRALYDEALW